jgi:hypothetical protein
MLPDLQSDLESLADIPRYTIDLTLQIEKRLYKAHAQVVLKNSESKALESLYFRLLPNGGAAYGNGRLDVIHTQVNGNPAETVLSIDDSALEVRLPQELQPGDEVRVEFDFEGSVPVDFGDEESPGAYGIYNYNQGVLSLSGWYPLLAVFDENGWHLDPVSAIGDSVFSETAFYDVTILTPKNLVLATTGVEIGEESTGVLRRSHYVSGPVRDFFLVASADFQVSTQEVDGTRVNSYYFREDEDSGITGLAVASESLSIFNRHFGKYPYVELDIVQAPMRNALGVEYPGTVLIGDSLYDDTNDPSFSVTIAHEVAHQWWYSVVGNDVFAEPWLDEALATYVSSLYYQEVLGEDAYRGLVSYWETRYDRLVQEGLDDQVTQDLEHFEGLGNPGVYSVVVYVKGALFFKSLREHIGDEAFFSALQQYYGDQKYGVASGDELLRAFEEASGAELDDFYQEWLFTIP